VNLVHLSTFDKLTELVPSAKHTNRVVAVEHERRRCVVNRFFVADRAHATGVLLCQGQTRVKITVNHNLAIVVAQWDPVFARQCRHELLGLFLVFGGAWRSEFDMYSFIACIHVCVDSIVP
jgi:hypothetical protein